MSGRHAAGILVLVFCALLPSCARRARARYAPSAGRSAATTTAPAASSEPLLGRGTATDPFLLCLADTATAPRTDYGFVASWHCADGSMPLGGAPMRGAEARVGNVGAGPDGHIVDLYRVPCASGPVDLYVDAYHCSGGVDPEIDLSNLSRGQLANLATSIRGLHRDPSSAEAFEARRFLLQWVIETSQISVILCTGIAPLLPEDPPRPYMSELMLSLAAAVIEDGRDPVDPVSTYVAAFTGLALYYQSALREDPSIRSPQMDTIVAMVANGTLRADLAARIVGCDLAGMGVHFAR